MAASCFWIHRVYPGVAALLLLALLAPATVAFADEIELAAASRGQSGALGHADFDRWTAILATVTHHGEEPRDVTITVELPDFDGGQRLHAARQVTLAPNSRREVIIPLRLPPVPRGFQPSWTEAINAQVRIFERQRGREVSVVRAEPVLITLNRHSLPPYWLGDDEADLDVVEAVCGTLGLELIHDHFVTAFGDERPEALADSARRVRQLRAADIPRSPHMMEQVGMLAIGAESADLTPAQAGALRQWLARGGRLWIMLDRTDPAWARQTLGEQWSITEIDRTQRTDLTVRSEARTARYHHDDPATLVRVMAEGFDVLHEAGGWPVALGRDVGRGRLLVTTLDVSAWPRLTDEAGGDEEEGEDFQPMAELADWLLKAPVAPRLVWPDPREASASVRPARRAMTDMVSGQVGFEVVSRGTVGWTLAGFCAFVLAATFLLHRWGRLEFIAPTTIIVAVLVAGVLLSISAAARRQVPLTIASGLMVDVTADGAIARLRGLVGYYGPDDVAANVRARDGGVLWRDGLWNTPRTIRHHWRDFDEYQWAGLALPGGQVHTFEADATTELDRPTTASATLDSTGATVHLQTGDLGALADPVILIGDSAVIPDIREGAFRLEPATTPAVRGQFIEAVQLTAAQRRRQAALRELTATTPDRFGSGEPALAGWSGALAERFTLIGSEEDAARRDEALVTMPLSVKTPRPGETVTVPWPLMQWRISPFSPLGLSQGEATPRADAMAFQQGQWATLRGPGGRVSLVFSLPRELSGIDPTGGSFSLHADAHGREVDLWVARDGALERIGHQRRGNRIDAEIDADQLQAIKQRGELVIVVDVGRADTEHSEWRIRQPRLNVTGVMGGGSHSPSGRTSDHE